MRKILVAFGTRPEAIKMCELVRELRKKEFFEVKVMVTGQHKSMLNQALENEGIVPDYNLDVMKIGQTLSYITGEILAGAERVISEFLPDLVLVHGDTSSAFAVALAAFYHGIEVAHIEAGLRTYDRASPFPEEFNRAAIALIAEYHFAPTEQARKNLLAEKIREDRIYVTGNTVADALASDITPLYRSAYSELAADKRLIILTAHRRENIDALDGIFRAVKRIVSEFPDVCVIYPVHKNEKIVFRAKEVFSRCPRVYLTEPLSSFDFHNLLNISYMIMTDSGGVQEEAGYLQKPTIILRNTTERKELLSNSYVKLVGTEENSVFLAAKKLLESERILKNSTVGEFLRSHESVSKAIADIIEQIKGT